MLHFPDAITDVLTYLAAVPNLPSEPIVTRDMNTSWSVSLDYEFRIIYDEELDTLLLWDDELEDTIGCGLAGNEAGEMVVALLLAMYHEHLLTGFDEVGL